MTLLNVGENRQPEKGILPSGDEPMPQATHHCKTTWLRGTAAKRSDTIY